MAPVPAKPSSNATGPAMTTPTAKQTAVSTATRTISLTPKGKDNPNNINYTVYDYMSVQRFTPLSNTNWYAADYVTAVCTSDWTATLTVVFNILAGTGPPLTLDVRIDVTSYARNCFRVRFNPDGPIEDFAYGPIRKAQLDYIRQNESVADPAARPTFVTDDGRNALVFDTADLKVYVNNNSAVVVTRKRDGQVVYKDDEIDGKSRGLMFVSRTYGTALASVRDNRKDDPSIDEAFYGAGQIVAENAGGDYFLERTGLAMTNYNYDNLNYNRPGVIPPEIKDDDGPDYYIPMYYAAPWLVVQGFRGRPEQYSYGWFLDNSSQTYMNTGDTAFNGAANKAYMGAACGPFDQHFVYGKGDGIEPVVTAFSLLQGKDYLQPILNKRAVMPPKYVFGFFQGVYGVRGLLKDSVLCTEENNFNTWEEVVEGYQGSNIPFEGLAVDIDVQDKLKVFTTRDTFWTKGKVGKSGDANNKSVFAWAQDKGLVTQTNITCFVRSDEDEYTVYKDLVESNVYTKNDAADAAIYPGPFATETKGPSDAYCGKLNYGGGDECRAIFPDWGRSDTARWWGKNYAKLFELGLNFVWQDMTVPAMAGHKRGESIQDEPDDVYLDNVPRTGEFNWKSYHPQVLVHDMRKDNGDREPFLTQRNLHAYRLCQSTYEEGILGQKNSLTKFKRSYIIARGGYIGNQHFGGVWVGDNSSTEEYLQMMLTTALNMNMSCMPIVGADIGGFTEYNGREKCPEKLMNRWVQAGCLMPWFRDHYDRWVDDKQHGKDKQELYEYPNILGSIRKAIELRYRWQEVLYTAMYQNVQTGAPLLKTMSMWNYDPEVNWNQKDQFLLGGHDGYQILCAPIVHENSDVRKVYLPRGARWIQYGLNVDDKKLGSIYDGGKTINEFKVAQDELTLFVREGAILPVRYTAEKGKNKSINSYIAKDPLVLEVFGLTEQSKGEIYLDDGGVTTDAEDKGMFTLLNVESKIEGTVGSLCFIAEQNKFWTNEPFYLRVRNPGTIISVEICIGTSTKSCSPVSAEDKYQFFSATGQCKYWLDGTSNSVWVRVPSGLIIQPGSVKFTCSDTVYMK